MASDFVRELINAGVHFGHRVSRWNPKMAPFIYGKRNSIHVLDIKETLKGLLRAQRFLQKVVGNGQDILFVGTKRQAKHLIADHARNVGMPFVSERWLGGTLTNFRTIRSRLSRLEELEAIEADGQMEKYSKKMKATLQREMAKMKRNLDGIRKMNRLPGALVLIDVRREHIAVREARKLKIPTVCLIDTDSDPDFADIVIPGNDDAIRSIDVVLGKLTDAVQAGLRSRSDDGAEEETAAPRRGRRPTTTARAEDMAKEDGILPEKPAVAAAPDEPAPTAPAQPVGDQAPTVPPVEPAPAVPQPAPAQPAEADPPAAEAIAAAPAETESAEAPLVDTGNEPASPTEPQAG